METARDINIILSLNEKHWLCILKVAATESHYCEGQQNRSKQESFCGEPTLPQRWLYGAIHEVQGNLQGDAYKRAEKRCVTTRQLTNAGTVKVGTYYDDVLRRYTERNTRNDAKKHFLSFFRFLQDSCSFSIVFFFAKFYWRIELKLLFFELFCKKKICCDAVRVFGWKILNFIICIEPIFFYCSFCTFFLSRCTCLSCWSFYYAFFCLLEKHLKLEFFYYIFAALPEFRDVCDFRDILRFLPDFCYFFFVRFLQVSQYCLLVTVFVALFAQFCMSRWQACKGGAAE